MSKVQTAINAVTVYPDRARVTRRGEATVQPGAHRLEISDLPLTLDPASVRAAARGTARARLIGVDVGSEFFADTPVEAVRQLEKEVEAVQDEISILDAEAEGLTSERAALLGVQSATDVYARGLAFGKITPADQIGLFSSLRERTAALDEQLQSMKQTRRERVRRLEKLENELQQLHSASGREKYSAAVEVEVAEGGNLTLEVTYVVSDASWTPLYDLRLSADSAELETGYLADVAQSTGEAWDGVSLTLSTARPALAATLPKLDPWFLHAAGIRPSKARPRAAMVRAPAPALAAEDYSAGSALEAAFYEAEEVVATVEASGAAVTYVLPAAATIPPDGAPHKVTVARYPLEPELDYVSAPKLVEAAYRRATVTNDSVYTLLPGRANLFAGDEFVGSTELELTAPGGEIELYLGVDDRVRVKRELKRREVDKRLLGDRRRLWYGYEIEVENLLNQDATVTLLDQFPVAGNEQVKVRLESVEPKPSSESELGLLEWELNLAPQEQRTVRFDFVVEHPRSMPIRGLP